MTQASHKNLSGKSAGKIRGLIYQNILEESCMRLTARRLNDRDPKFKPRVTNQNNNKNIYGGDIGFLDAELQSIGAGERIEIAIARKVKIIEENIMKCFNWTVLLVALVTILSTGNVLAADWSSTEVQLQVGTLDVAYSGGETSDTEILTYQHASGWKYGDNFFFADLFRNEDDDLNVYTEWYPTISFGKIAGKDSFGGPLKDIAVILGINYDGDADVLKYLPGIRLAWDVPGFAFLNTDFTAYIEGKSDNGDVASEEENSWMIDVSWALPFKLGSQSFSFEGHMEYIAERERTSGSFEGSTVEAWFLAQPQLRWDIGQLMFNTPNTVFVGIEYQYWMNKLGDPDTDESAVQALLVWRF